MTIVFSDHLEHHSRLVLVGAMAVAGPGNIEKVFRVLHLNTDTLTYRNDAFDAAVMRFHRESNDHFIYHQAHENLFEIADPAQGVKRCAIHLRRGRIDYAENVVSTFGVRLQFMADAYGPCAAPDNDCISALAEKWPHVDIKCTDRHPRSKHAKRRSKPCISRIRKK